MADPDSFYVQDCRQVESNTHAIQTLAGQLMKMVGGLESEKDFNNCRQMVEDAVRQASETRTILLRIKEHQNQAQNPGERNNRRMMYRKLSDNLGITARVLEDVVRRFSAAERKHFARLENESVQLQDKAKLGGGGLGFNQEDSTGRGDSQQPLIDMGGGPGSTGETALQSPFDDEELRQERCQALRRVDEDMKCLQRIYTDLATAAEEQQASFDSLESHMASAAIDVERGREEISLGRYGWREEMRRKVMAGGVGALLLLVLGSYMFS
eukprot:TRINITY_DN21979_c0_g1_i1.p1 TRINITY_DN21979_c0_g1~~TRINITY_DN21979_c0_g1_i1.p1  ORF type:complete len:269 (+),score=79.75 TRINITY_DN21979_c0_g1_i1:78-884(+)